MGVRKIYQAIEFKDLETYEVVNGVKRTIQFKSSSPALEAKGKFVTTDPAVIAAMDQTISRGNGAYKCISTETFYDDDEPLPDIPKDSGATDGEDPSGEEKKITEVPGIKTIQDARAYMNKEFEIPLSKMPNGGAVKKAAAEHKVSFPDLG